MYSRFFLSIHAALCAAALCLAAAACDDGPIEDKVHATTEGKKVQLEGIVRGCEAWADGYSVNIAGFDDDGLYATIAKVIIPPTTADGHISVYLEGIPEGTSTVSLCVLNRLRQRIASFAEVDVSNASTRDIVHMDVGTVNVGQFAAIQQSYFNTTCAACHGQTGRAAAGLFLTEGRSYEALVGAASTKVEGAQLVAPGDAGASVLYRALTTELTADWREYHRDLVSEYTQQNILPIIRAWINNGAPE